MLKKIISFFCGYTRIYITSEQFKKAVPALYPKGIFYLYKKTSRKETSFSFEKKYSKRAEQAFCECGIDILSTKEMGMPALFKRYKRRPGMLLGFLIILISLFASRMFIWNINISGIDKVSREDALALLNEHGIYIGAFTPSLDLKTIYNEILLENDDFCWISVNIRGTVANVEVRESEQPLKMTPDKGKYANIVAECDGEITQLEVHDGQTSVKTGDSVKEGELLVSGIYEDKMGRTVLSYASGKVYAKTRRDFYIEVPLEYEKKVYTGNKEYDMSVNFFSKTINIINNSRKIETKYDIIVNNEQPCLFGSIYLPLTYKLTTHYEYQTQTVVRSEEQAKRIAYENLNREIAEYVGDGEILSKQTQEQLDGSIYTLSISVYMNTDIAKTQEFIFDEG